MSWLKSDQSLRDHPKKDHLAELLFNGSTPNDVADYASAGVLHYLWYWALDYAQDGDLGKFTDRQIAKGCRWQGDPVLLVQALTAAGFVDEKTRRIHDWDEWAGVLIQRRERNAEYMRKARGEHVASTSNTRDGKSRKSDKHGAGARVSYSTKARARAKAKTPVDNSPVSVDNSELVCWRCAKPITNDELLDDLIVISQRGTRHRECGR